MELFVIGLGYVGLPLAIEAVKSGIKVIGFDIDSKKIDKLNEGIFENLDISKKEFNKYLKSNQISFLSKLPREIDDAVFIIAVPTPLNYNLSPDLSYLEKACDFIGDVIGKNCLVINESTSYIGTLRNLIKPRIDSRSKILDIEYAVAPERIDPGNKTWNIKNTPRVIAGISKKAEALTVNLYSKICDRVINVSSPEIAEAAKLMENTYRQVNIALANEFSDILNGFGISPSEAINAAATKPFGFSPFRPSIGVGGHCIPIDPTYLSYSASLVDVNTKLIDTSYNINLNRFNVVIKKIAKEFNQNFSNIRIQIAGISYKVGVADTRESPSLKLLYELRKMGAHVTWHDPLVEMLLDESSADLDPNIDLGLIVTPHEVIDFSIWKNAEIKVWDLSISDQNFGWSKFF